MAASTPPTDYPPNPPRAQKNGIRNIWIGVGVALLVPFLSVLVTGARLAAGIDGNTEDIRDINNKMVPRMEIDAKFGSVKTELGTLKAQNARILLKLDRALERAYLSAPGYRTREEPTGAASAPRASDR